MLKYGLELELFQAVGSGKIVIPNKNLPLDGCGALIELRSEPHLDLYKAFGEIQSELKKLQETGVLLSFVNRHIFSQDEYWQARKQSFKNTSVEFCNIYNKNRRLLKPNMFAASLQLNISNFLGKINNVDTYGLIDVYNVVKKLDKEFEKEIKESKRVAGEYCIKDNIRLEYRSLPNNVFLINNIEKRILKALGNIA